MRLSLQIAVATGLALAALAYLYASTEDPVNLWLTPDQRAYRLYEDKQFSEAGDLFEDPMWKGQALYDTGRYLEAGDAYARVPGAVGWFNRGDSLIKVREYVQAIPTFEQAVLEDPEWPEAQENLELSRYILYYLEETRAAQGTESDGSVDELGADEYKFDMQSDDATEMQIDKDSVVEGQSAEKWMRSVDTRTGDFLRLRFQLEASAPPPEEAEEETP